MTNVKLREEFAWRKTLLYPTNKGQNYISLGRSWILPLWGFLVLRTVIALFCVTIIIVSGVRQGSPVWFIYLTNWSFFLLTCSTVALCLVTAIHLFHPPTRQTDVENNTESHPPEIRWYEKVAWFFWIVGSNSAIIVTVLYWTLVFIPPTDFMDIAVHALNSVVMLIELYIGIVPVHIVHFIYPAMFAAVYSVFVVIFWAAGGENSSGKPYIYKRIDLENGNRGVVVAILLVTTFVVCPIVQFILFTLYQTRCYICTKIKFRDGNNCDLELAVN